MARGFWTGLGHGAALSAIVLVALSLVSPVRDPGSLPRTDGESASEGRERPESAEPVRESLPSETAPQPVPEPPAGQVADAPERAPAPDASDADAPRAEAVGLPVGSEFGRGGDVLPAQPAPLATPAPRMDQADAPAVSAPAAEPAPVAITEIDTRPDAPEDAARPAQTSPVAGEDAPDIARPGSLDVPTMTQAPQMTLSGDPDALPDAPAMRTAPPDAADTSASARAPESTDAAVARPAEPASTPVPPRSDTIDAQAVAAASQQDARDADRPREPARTDSATVPAMPAPALDLSLPPDLSDLRAMERN